MLTTGSISLTHVNLLLEVSYASEMLPVVSMTFFLISNSFLPYTSCFTPRSLLVSTITRVPRWCVKSR